MNILVLGQGGREHAIVKALKGSPTLRNSMGRLFCAPGSAGISLDAECVGLDPSDKLTVLNFVQRQKIDLVVVGPEQPLVDGISNHLRENGVRVFGPSQAGARLEGSKIFSKEFMKSAHVPTARFQIVSSVAETQKALETLPTPCVFKADGLAAGKGVFICKTNEDVIAAARDTFEMEKFGASGTRALIEEFLPGWELSYLILTNGVDFEPLCLSQDHKRLFDGDRGPNTGGMGTIAPLSINESLDQEIRTKIAAPVVQELLLRGIDYRGVLYIGIMVTSSGPFVLEFNVRFGDPEAQVILPLLDGDWASIFNSIAQGEVPKLSWRTGAAACVVLAAEGYPESPVKGAPIGAELDSGDDVAYLLHAGTTRAESGQWLTAGGRVLNAVGLGIDLKSALLNAYNSVEKIAWANCQYRKDIGKKSPNYQSKFI